MKAPSPGLLAQSDLSPKGEVIGWHRLAPHHLSLGGEVAAKRRVRGPSLFTSRQTLSAPPALR